MLRVLHALVFALVASLGIASDAHALGSESALRKNFSHGSERVGTLAIEAFGMRQQSASHGTAVASECSYAARGAVGVARSTAPGAVRLASSHPEMRKTPLIPAIFGSAARLSAGSRRSLHRLTRPGAVLRVGQAWRGRRPAQRRQSRRRSSVPRTDERRSGHGSPRHQQQVRAEHRGPRVGLEGLVAAPGAAVEAEAALGE
jgi:hypothetical protein